MRRTLFHGKIHRATVTHADLDYEGSITIDADLLEAADILPHEQVHVWNITNGERLTTYTLAGERGSGVICMNGAAAHRAGAGDLVIIAAFVELEDAEAREHTPNVVLVDRQNRIVERSPEVPGPARRAG